MRDEAVPLDDPCADGQVKTVMKSRGYRKVAGDICVVGTEGLDFEPYEFNCCSADVHPVNCSSTPGVSPSVSTYYQKSSNPNPSPSAMASVTRPANPNQSVKIIVKDNKPVVSGLGIALAIAILIAISLGLLAAILMW